jgi:hypothetical protein
MITLPSKAVTKRVLNDEILTTPDKVTAESVAALVAALAKREWTMDHILNRLEADHPVGQAIRVQVLRLKLQQITKEAAAIKAELDASK